jgi:hypothetical protein
MVKLSKIKMMINNRYLKVLLKEISISILTLLIYNVIAFLYVQFNFEYSKAKGFSVLLILIFFTHIFSLLFTSMIKSEKYRSIIEIVFFITILMYFLTSFPFRLLLLSLLYLSLKIRVIYGKVGVIW